MDCIEGLCMETFFNSTEGQINFANSCEAICGYPTCHGRYWERYPVG